MKIETLFFLSVFALSILSAFGISAVFFFLTRFSGLGERMARLARARVAGAVLAACGIVCLVPNIMPILDQDSTLRLLLWPLVPVALVFCVIWLDFLFSRSTAALMILLSHFLLKETYPLGIPYSSFFDVCLFLLGISGMFLAAKPHWFRELFLRSCKHGSLRYASGAFFLLFALSGAWCFIYSLKAVI